MKARFPSALESCTASMQTWSMFGQYAEGYRPPNFAEANQSFVNLGYRYATVPNPELSAENSKGLEFGLRAELPERVPACRRLPEPLHQLHRKRICRNAGIDQLVSESKHR